MEVERGSEAEAMNVCPAGVDALRLAVLAPALNPPAHGTLGSGSVSRRLDGWRCSLGRIAFYEGSAAPVQTLYLCE